MKPTYEEKDIVLDHVLESYKGLTVKIENLIIENGGELTEELEKSLSNLELSVKEKVDGYSFIIESLKDRARYWDEKSALLKKYSKTCSSVVERLRGNLKNYMLLEDKSEICGNETRFKLQQTTYSLDYNESEIPEEFFKTEVIRSIDKEKIKTAIKDGLSIDGVVKIDSFSLRAYPNNSPQKD